MKKFIFLAATIILIGFVNQARAGSNQTDWQKDKSEVKKVLSQDCKKAFEILWPWAKQSNLEARYLLAGLLQWGDMYFPTGRDFASRKRDMLILSVHSSGYADDQKSSDLRNLIYNIENINSIDKDFAKCIRVKPSQQCAELAVSHETVPSFEEYAKQIDHLLVEGKDITCSDQKVAKDISKDN